MSPAPMDPKSTPNQYIIVSGRGSSRQAEVSQTGPTTATRVRELTMSTALIAACITLTLINAPAASAQSSEHEHSDKAVAGGGSLPAGWSARPDGTGDAKSIKFTTMEPGYHVTLGPATILYRATDMAKG